MGRRYFIIIAMSFLFFLCSGAWADPGEADPDINLFPPDFKIVGTLKVNDDQIAGNGSGYIVVITKPNGDHFFPVAEDKDGLESDLYRINFYTKTDQQDGDTSSDMAVIHVYKEITVMSPPSGGFVLNTRGPIKVVDVEARDSLTRCGVKGDINDDDKIGLEEAIHALQMVSGIK